MRADASGGDISGKMKQVEALFIRAGGQYFFARWGQIDGVAVVRPDVAAVIRAAYDPVLPAMATDPAHALRLAARLERVQ